MANPGDRDADHTYSALTDETRVRILFALAEQYDEAWSSTWPTFSELRDRVGVEDTSRFSYHLDELQDDLVRKVDGRYVPRVAALEIVSTIEAGTYDGADVAVDPRRTDYGCPYCERDLVASYRDHHVYVRCPEHGAAVAYPTPPRAVDGRSLSDVVDLSLRKHASDVRRLREGVCPYCWGPAGLSFPRGSVPDSYLLTDVPYATAACETCWLSYPIPVAHAILGHPAVETLYAERGLGPVDAQLGPHDLARLADVDEYPGGQPAVRLTVELDDRGLGFDLDESCAVIDHRQR